MTNRNRYTAIPLFAVFVVVLLNFFFTRDLLFHSNNASYKLLTLTSSLSFAIAFVSLVSISRIVFIPFFIFFIFLGSILSYFKFFYNVDFNEGLVECLLNTDVDEISTVINYQLVAWVSIFTIITSFVLIKYASWLNVALLYRIKVAVIGMILGAVIFYIPVFLMVEFSQMIFLKNTLNMLYPVNVGVTLKNYNALVRIKDYDNKRDVFEGHKFKYDHKGVKVVIVIGESARSDRFGINGYKRDTTPKLGKINELISFKNAFSLATYTIKGVSSIFKTNPDSSENTIIEAFNRLGFKTTWITLQSLRAPIHLIASESKKVITKDMIWQKTTINRDEVLPHMLRDILITNPDDNLFIVMHTNGSHYTYESRYTPKFKKYTPTIRSISTDWHFERLFEKKIYTTSLNEYSNAYDNTILYTDHVLNDLIEELKQYKSMFIYISDHGESLGEGGIFHHTHDYATAPKEQIHIPYILWASEKLKEQDEAIIKNLKVAKGNENKKVDQSTVIHSILDCLGIDSSFIDKRKSICSKLLEDAKVRGVT
jgi:lipid A ethanolaminephosphotransferase